VAVGSSDAGIEARPVILIFVALESEMAACLGCTGEVRDETLGDLRVVRSESVAICQTGIGRRALQVAEQALAKMSPTMVLSVGIAGGLAPDLGIGDAVLCERVSHPAQPNPVLCDAGLVAAAKQVDDVAWRIGASVTVDEPAWGPEEKAALHGNGEHHIVEMESYWIGAAARAVGLPFLTVRTVSDGSAHSLTNIPGLFDDSGKVDTERLLEYTREHPDVIPLLAEQRERSQAAFDSLRVLMPPLLAALSERTR
jgi:adenosylhomocysteine nucleosidase